MNEEMTDKKGKCMFTNINNLSSTSHDAIDSKVHHITSGNHRDDDDSIPVGLIDFLPRKDFVKKITVKPRYPDLENKKSEGKYTGAAGNEHKNSVINSAVKKHISPKRFLNVSLEKIQLPSNTSTNAICIDLSKSENLELLKGNYKTSLNSKTFLSSTSSTLCESVKTEDKMETEASAHFPEQDTDISENEVLSSDSVLSYDEAVKTLHNQKLELLLETVSLNGHVESVPIETTLVLKGLVQESIEHACYTEDEDLRILDNLTDPGKDVDYTLSCADYMQSDKSDILHIKEEILKHGSEFPDQRDICLNLINVSCDNSTENKCNELDNVQKNNVLNDEEKAVRSSSEEMQEVGTCGDVMKSKEKPEKGVTKVNTNKFKDLPKGERTGKCNHQLPMWDLHDYCNKCRRSKLLPWVQHCQKTGPLCDICTIWNNLRWSYYAEESVLLKKRKKKKKRKLFDSDHTEYAGLPKLLKYSESELNSPDHIHSAQHEDGDSFVSPQRSSGRRSKVKRCSCCVPDMPVLRPYAYDESDIFLDDSDVETKHHHKGRGRGRKKSVELKLSEDRPRRKPGRPKGKVSLPKSLQQMLVRQVGDSEGKLYDHVLKNSSSTGDSLSTVQAPAEKTILTGNTFSSFNNTKGDNSNKQFSLDSEGKNKLHTLLTRPLTTNFFSSQSLSDVRCRSNPEAAMTMSGKPVYSQAVRPAGAYRPHVPPALMQQRLSTPIQEQSSTPFGHCNQYSVNRQPYTQHNQLPISSVKSFHVLENHVNTSVSEPISCSVKTTLPIEFYGNVNSSVPAVPGNGKPGPGNTEQIRIPTPDTYSCQGTYSSHSSFSQVIPIPVVQENRGLVSHGNFNPISNIANYETSVPQNPTVINSFATSVRHTIPQVRPVSIYGSNVLPGYDSNITVPQKNVNSLSHGLLPGKPAPHGKPVPTLQGHPLPQQNVKPVNSNKVSASTTGIKHNDSFNIIDFVLSDGNTKANYKDIDQQARHNLSINIGNEQRRFENSSTSSITSPTESIASKSCVSNLHSPSQFSPEIDKPKQAKARTKADILARLKWKKTARKSLSEDGQSPSSMCNDSPRTSPELQQASVKAPHEYGPVSKLNVFKEVKKKPVIKLKDIMKSRALSPELEMHVRKLKSAVSNIMKESNQEGETSTETRTEANVKDLANVDLPKEIQNKQPGMAAENFVQDKDVLKGKEKVPNYEKYILHERVDSSEDDDCYNSGTEDAEASGKNNAKSACLSSKKSKSTPHSVVPTDVEGKVLEAIDLPLQGEDIEEDELEIPAELEPDKSDDEPDYDEWMRATMLDSTAEEHNVFMDDDIEKSDDAGSDTSVSEIGDSKVTPVLKELSDSEEIKSYNGRSATNLKNNGVHDACDEANISSDVDGFSSQQESEAEFDLQKLVAEKQQQNAALNCQVDENTEENMEDTVSDTEVNQIEQIMKIEEGGEKNDDNSDKEVNSIKNFSKEECATITSGEKVALIKDSDISVENMESYGTNKERLSQSNVEKSKNGQSDGIEKLTNSGKNSTKSDMAVTSEPNTIETCSAEIIQGRNNEQLLASSPDDKVDTLAENSFNIDNQVESNKTEICVKFHEDSFEEQNDKDTKQSLGEDMSLEGSNTRDKKVNIEREETKIKCNTEETTPINQQGQGETINTIKRVLEVGDEDQVNKDVNSEVISKNLSKKRENSSEKLASEMDNNGDKKNNQNKNNNFFSSENSKTSSVILEPAMPDDADQSVAIGQQWEKHNRDTLKSYKSVCESVISQENPGKTVLVKEKIYKPDDYHVPTETFTQLQAGASTSNDREPLDLNKNTKKLAAPGKLIMSKNIEEKIKAVQVFQVVPKTSSSSHQSQGDSFAHINMRVMDDSSDYDEDLPSQLNDTFTSLSDSEVPTSLEYSNAFNIAPPKERLAGLEKPKPDYSTVSGNSFESTDHMHAALGMLGLASSFPPIRLSGNKLFLPRDEGTVSDSSLLLAAGESDLSYDYPPAYEVISDSDECSSPMPQPVDLSKQGPYSQENKLTENLVMNVAETKSDTVHCYERSSSILSLPGTLPDNVLVKGNGSAQNQSISLDLSNKSCDLTATNSTSSNSKLQREIPKQSEVLICTRAVQPGVTSGGFKSAGNSTLLNIPSITSNVPNSKSANLLKSESDDALNLSLSTGHHSKTKVLSKSKPDTSDNELIIDPHDPNIVQITTVQSNSEMFEKSLPEKKVLSIDPAVAFSTDGTNDYCSEDTSDDDENNDENQFSVSVNSTDEIENVGTSNFTKFDKNFIINSSSDEEILKCAVFSQEEVVVISDDSEGEEDSFQTLSQCVVQRNDTSKNKNKQEVNVLDDEDWGSSFDEFDLDLENLDIDWNVNTDGEARIVLNDIMKDSNISPATKKFVAQVKETEYNCDRSKKQLTELFDSSEYKIKPNDPRIQSVTALEPSATTSTSDAISVTSSANDTLEGHELTQEFCQDLFDNEMDEGLRSPEFPAQRKQEKPSSCAQNKTHKRYVDDKAKVKIGKTRKRKNEYNSLFADLSSSSSEADESNGSDINKSFDLPKARLIFKDVNFETLEHTSNKNKGCLNIKALNEVKTSKQNWDKIKDNKYYPKGKVLLRDVFNDDSLSPETLNVVTTFLKRNPEACVSNCKGNYTDVNKSVNAKPVQKFNSVLENVSGDSSFEVANVKKSIFLEKSKTNHVVDKTDNENKNKDDKGSCNKPLSVTSIAMKEPNNVVILSENENKNKDDKGSCNKPLSVTRIAMKEPDNVIILSDSSDTVPDDDRFELSNRIDNSLKPSGKEVDLQKKFKPVAVEKSNMGNIFVDDSVSSTVEKCNSFLTSSERIHSKDACKRKFNVNSDTLSSTPKREPTFRDSDLAATFIRKVTDLPGIEKIVVEAYDENEHSFSNSSDIVQVHKDTKIKEEIEQEFTLPDFGIDEEFEQTKVYDDDITMKENITSSESTESEGVFSSKHNIKKSKLKLEKKRAKIVIETSSDSEDNCDFQTLHSSHSTNKLITGNIERHSPVNIVKGTGKIINDEHNQKVDSAENYGKQKEKNKMNKECLPDKTELHRKGDSLTSNSGLNLVNSDLAENDKSIPPTESHEDEEKRNQKIVRECSSDKKELNDAVISDSKAENRRISLKVSLETKAKRFRKINRDHNIIDEKSEYCQSKSNSVSINRIKFTEPQYLGQKRGNNYLKTGKDLYGIESPEFTAQTKKDNKDNKCKSYLAVPKTDNPTSTSERSLSLTDSIKKNAIDFEDEELEVFNATKRKVDGPLMKKLKCKNNIKFTKEKKGTSSFLNRGRLSPMSKMIRKARLEELARRNSKKQQVADSRKPEKSKVPSKSSCVYETKSEAGHALDEEILHASQSVDVCPKKTRPEAIEWDQMFQDLPTTSTSLFDGRPKAGNCPEKSEINNQSRQLHTFPTQSGVCLSPIKHKASTKPSSSIPSSSTNYPQEQSYDKHKEKFKDETCNVEMSTSEKRTDKNLVSNTKIRGKRKVPLSCDIPQPNLKKKTPDKFGTLPPADCNRKFERSVNDFLWRLFKWNALWLQEQEKVGQTPPVVDKQEVFPLLDTYDSYEDYVNIMTPLFLLETWESMYKSWYEGKRESKVIKMPMLPVNCITDPDKRFMEFTFQGILPPRNAPHQTHTPNEGDLVVVHLQCNPAKSGQIPQLKPVFGYVMSSKRGNANTFRTIHSRFAKEDSRRPPMILELNIKTLCRRQLCLVQDMPMTVEVVDSLISQIRQYTALLFLPRSPLARDILRPCNPRVFHCKYNNNNVKPYGQYNTSQTAAIFSASSAVHEPYAIPKIMLLQGPPGTGKSSTILGIIRQIVNTHGPSKSSPKACILLCAPSNGGIDELARRLIKERKKAENKSPKEKLLNIVRIGKPASAHPEVQNYCLGELVQRNFKICQTESIKKRMSSVHSALKEQTTKIERVKAQIKSLIKENKQSQAEDLDRELQREIKRKKHLEASICMEKTMTPAEENRIRKEILQNADIICCTLNSSGSNKVLDSICGIGQSKDAIKNSHFACVIIDEATQTTEVDSLIPLQYGCSKLVLVGDPEQLPATVLSQSAERRNFSQSLFERLYIFFNLNPHNPVQMLKQQYRMHPEICCFPSKHVYNGKLITNNDIAKEREMFPMKPYLLFNTKFTQEKLHGSGSTYNPEEASVVVELCIELKKHKKLPGIQIGVVTPYQRQRNVIINILKDKHIEHIEVSTIDGYQGREKDIIVMSCVRANSNSGSIGFLADRRRMNVALTRARYALYVVGHLDSLKVNEDWRSLIQDAESRHRVVSINCDMEVTNIIQKSINN